MPKSISEKGRKDAVNRAVDEAYELRKRLERMTVEQFDEEKYSVAVDVTNILYKLRRRLNGGADED